MGFTLQSSALLLIAVIVFVMMVFPVYLAARFVDARRATLAWSALAVPVASLAAWLGYQMLGPFFGFLTAYLGMAIGFWLVLRPSFAGALGMTLIAFVLQLVVVQVLLRLFAS